jgi:hypothetical protein
MANKTDELYNAIVDAVSYWLGYQFKIGRDQLIHEASLRYPIADTITAKGIAIHRIVLEKLHPVFMSKKIDLVIYAESVQEPEAEKDDSNLLQVYEFKLAKKKSSDEYGDEHQRVFDDVVRLAYYNMWFSKDCYFVMCGSYGDFKNYFIGQANPVVPTSGKNIVHQSKGKSVTDTEWKSDGLYKEWFGFNLGEVKEKEFIEIDGLGSKGDWGLKSFKKNYDIRKEVTKTYSDRIKVKTQCVAITPVGLEKTRTHAVGIWKIVGTN